MTFVLLRFAFIRFTLSALEVSAMKPARNLLLIGLAFYFFPVVGQTPVTTEDRTWSVFVGIVIISTYYAAKSMRRRYLAAIEAEKAECIREGWPLGVEGLDDRRLRRGWILRKREIQSEEKIAVAVERTACLRDGRPFDEERFLDNERAWRTAQICAREGYPQI
jgi:hypothetical protein